MKRFVSLLTLFFIPLLLSTKSSADIEDKSTYLIVLGIAQDAGYPHINNPKEYDNVSRGMATKELVVSLGLIDKQKPLAIELKVRTSPRSLYPILINGLNGSAV